MDVRRMSVLKEGKDFVTASPQFQCFYSFSGCLDAANKRNLHKVPICGLDFSRSCGSSPPFLTFRFEKPAARESHGAVRESHGVRRSAGALLFFHIIFIYFIMFLYAKSY